MDQRFQPLACGRQNMCGRGCCHRWDKLAQGTNSLAVTLKRDRLPLVGQTVSYAAGCRVAETIPATFKLCSDGVATTVQSSKPWRILVVDDNDDAAALLAVLLRLEGHEVQTAGNGGEAVDRAELFRPEVVLMDLEMPGIDGLEASRRIRARPWGTTVLIAALTGWGREVDRRRAREAGVDLHFIKPVNTESLLGAVTESLKSARCITP